MSALSKIYNFFNNPRTALLIILLFFLGYYLSIGLTVGFGNNFLKFGPNKDDTGKYTHFMGIQIDSWKMVIVVYIIIFISTILQSYYINVVNQNIHAYVWNTAIEKVPYSKFWTYLVLLVNPFVNMLLTIIKFYATATFQIQYVIPQFIGGYITDVPFTLKWLSDKTFKS